MEYGDQTQPTAEILNALSPVKNEQEHPQLPPPSEFESLSAQLRQNPHNPDGWRRLIRVAEETGDIRNISTAYDALLAQYPNNVCPSCFFGVAFFPPCDLLTKMLRPLPKFNISAIL
jgi:cleavage stimulation factor subunit 3